MTKVIGISGSPRHANTETLVAEALKAATEVGPVETELISLADLEINPCQGCYKCYGYNQGANWDKMCYKYDDDVASVYRKIAEADGVIVGSPVYTLDVSAKLKALMERGACFCHYSASPLAGAIRNKVFGGIVVAFERRGGQESALQSIWRWAAGIMFSFVVGAVPFPDDPPPQSSALGGLADTCDSKAGLGRQGALASTSRIEPPTSGVYNLRSVRNLGKTVALSSLIVSRGLEQLAKEGIKVPPIPLVPFPSKIIKADSYLDQVQKGLTPVKPYHKIMK